MKVYIAARYDRRVELRPLAERLKLLGHEVTSRWLWDGEEGKTIQDAAVMDMEDVREADWLIFIGEPRGSKNRGGGRWFEFGAAWALGKHCVAVLDVSEDLGGHGTTSPGHESVFTALPDVEVVADRDELMVIMAREDL